MEIEQTINFIKESKDAKFAIVVLVLLISYIIIRGIIITRNSNGGRYKQIKK